MNYKERRDRFITSIIVGVAFYLTFFIMSFIPFYFSEDGSYECSLMTSIYGASRPAMVYSILFEVCLIPLGAFIGLNIGFYRKKLVNLKKTLFFFNFLVGALAIAASVTALMMVVNTFSVLLLIISFIGFGIIFAGSLIDWLAVSTYESPVPPRKVTDEKPKEKISKKTAYLYLLELKDLFDKGIITEEEYNEKKAKYTELL